MGEVDKLSFLLLAVMIGQLLILCTQQLKHIRKLCDGMNEWLRMQELYRIYNLSIIEQSIRSGEKSLLLVKLISANRGWLEDENYDVDYLLEVICKHQDLKACKESDA